MPTYPHVCPNGHRADLLLPASERDEPQDCPVCSEKMQRQMTVPMAVTWGGRFHSPWHKKQEGTW